MTLRSRMIRLAHARPELRGELLPLLLRNKMAGYQYIPDDFVSLGFDGPERDDEAEAVGDALRGANHAIRRAVVQTVKEVADVLGNAASDARPGLARAAVYLAYSDMLDNIKGDVEHVIDRIPYRAARRPVR